MRSAKPKRTHRKLWFFAVLVVIYGGWSVQRPLPALQPQFPSAAISGQAPASKLTWPGDGQAASGILGTSLLQTHGVQKAVPIASTAKLITALTVLQAKPLQPGQPGPTLTMTANDVALYSSYLAQEGSVVQVTVGEQLSEYQVLQGMMLPSANNLADSLAVWAFGSLANYQTAAKAYLAAHGLNSTQVGSDASGFSPSTTSTASDLVKLGELAMQNPALAQIVNQSTATLPVAGEVSNVNSLLGSYGIIGVKTGNTDQAGGVFVSASQVPVNGKTETIVTAVANTPSLPEALTDSVSLILSAQADFSNVTVASKGAIVGHYKQPWGGMINVIAAQDLKVVAPGSTSVPATVKIENTPVKSAGGQIVGKAQIKASPLFPARSVNLKLAQAPTQPSLWWRLLHPF